MNRSYKKYIIRLGMLLACLAIFLAAYVSTKKSSPLVRWNWDSINFDTLTFPNNFLWGCCITEYQVSGAHHSPNSNWAHFEKKQNLTKSGCACDHWNRYKDDIALVKNLGANALRFCPDWSIIEPHEGHFDQTAITHYQQVCDELLASGIQPMITLHHFVHPRWFEKKGGFEKEENIQYFVRFAQEIFKALNNKTTLWCTINEPSMAALEGYLTAMSPPGKFIAFKQASIVLKNLLLAHVATYKALKKLPGGSEAKIGIVHAIPRFRAYHDWNFVCRYGASQLNAFVVDSVLDFFKTGTFNLKLFEGLFTTRAECPDAPNSNDFIGLNYYSKILVGLTGSCWPSDAIKTDMPYTMYAEGLYDAIHEIAQLNVPVYITENGVADAADSIRDLWLKRHLFALNKAINDGYDVRGYFYWSLLDDYEWGFGYNMKFGLYHVDYASQERTLRKGAEYFIAMAKAHTAST